MSVYQCTECGFQYDESLGDKHEGLRPGTRWLSLPEDFACPGCSVRLRDDFSLLPQAQTPVPPASDI